MLGATSARDALLWRWHEREALAVGATREEWTAAVERMTYDQCATFDANLRLLRSAGFKDVAAHFADGRFAGSRRLPRCLSARFMSTFA